MKSITFSKYGWFAKFLIWGRLRDSSGRRIYRVSDLNRGTDTCHVVSAVLFGALSGIFFGGAFVVIAGFLSSVAFGFLTLTWNLIQAIWQFGFHWSRWSEAAQGGAFLWGLLAAITMLVAVTFFWHRYMKMPPQAAALFEAAGGKACAPVEFVE